MEEEGGEGGGGDVGGGEPEDLSELSARIELNWGCFSKNEEACSLVCV